MSLSLVLHIFGSIVLILSFTRPEFVLTTLFFGKDLIAIADKENKEHPLRLVAWGIYSFLHSLVYYPILIFLPVVIFYALINNLGAMIISLIAMNSAVYLIGRNVYLFWNSAILKENKIEIEMPSGKRYKGIPLSEEKAIYIEAVTSDGCIIEHLSGILIEEKGNIITIETEDGLLTASWNFFKQDGIRMESKRVTVAEILLEDGTEKKGKRVHILGENWMVFSFEMFLHFFLGGYLIHLSGLV